MNDQFDHELQTLLSDSLRDRASRVDAHGRGFGDVRRRVRRRRQRQVAVSLLPTAAVVGWFVSRPVASDPLRPSDGVADSTATSAVCQPVGVPTAPTGEPTTSDVVPIVTMAVTVVEGESWSVLAERYGLGVDELMSFNSGGSEAPPLLFPGTVIAVPVSPITSVGASEPTVTETTYSWVPKPYVVQEGDTWNKVAESLGPDVALLQAANGRSGEDPNTLLEPDLVLAIPTQISGSGPATATTISWSVSQSYVVQEGDSWNTIAETFGPNLDLLLAVNGRTGEDLNTVLTRGQVIAIPTAVDRGDASVGEPYVVQCVSVSPTTVPEWAVTTAPIPTPVPSDTVIVSDTADPSLQTTTTSIG